MAKQYLIVGMGRFGSQVATSLFEMGQEVLAIDAVEENLKAVAERVTHALVADCTDVEVLKKIGAKNFDVAIVAIGENIQSSIMTVLLLKEQGIPMVIAKASSDMQGKVLAKVGADKIIYPESDMGQRLARNLVSPNLLDFIQLTPQFRIGEVHPDKAMIGKNLKTINLRQKYNMNVILIRRDNGDVALSPGGEDIINENDVLVLGGELRSWDKIQHLLKE